MKSKTCLSIIICSYNRDKYILDAIKSVSNQSISRDHYEVIIIDNNSTDTTPQIVPEYISDHNLKNVHYHTEANQGLTFARNRGIYESKNELISFIDDDALVASDYVESIINSFEYYPEINALGGKVIPIYPETPEPKWLSKYIEGILSRVDLGEEITFFKKKYPVGCNMIFRKSIFETYGLFNTDLVLRSDEKDLFLKLKSKGEKILYVPKIRVEHVMSAQRVSKEGVIKVSIITGEGERFRCQRDRLKSFKKFTEYSLKLCVSLILSLALVFKSKSQAKYLILVRWYILKGFLFPMSTLNDKT